MLLNKTNRKIVGCRNAILASACAFFFVYCEETSIVIVESDTEARSSTEKPNQESGTGESTASSSKKSSSSTQVSSSSNDNKVITADSAEDLPVCSAKREGMFAYVKGEKTAYICNDGEWITENSSNVIFSLSSMGEGDIGRQSSSSVYVPPVTTSSSSEEVILTGLGTCTTGKTSVEQGTQVTWSIKWGSTITSTDKFGKITYLWTLPDATPSTGTAASAAVTYASWGPKTASVSVSFESGKKGTIDCTPVNVNGARITGCTCELVTSSIELTEDPTATWIIKGPCTSTAAITGYKWAGAVAAEDGLSATVTYTKATQTDAPTVQVTNAESTILSLACKAPRITDANNPETNITLKYSDTRTAFAGGTLYHVTYADNRGALICVGTGTVTCGSNAPVEVNHYGVKVGNFDECGTVDVSAGASIECANTW